jgi:hypothetical protein
MVKHLSLHLIAIAPLDIELEPSQNPASVRLIKNHDTASPGKLNGLHVPTIASYIVNSKYTTYMTCPAEG